jgi:prevent-host-death family protein
MPTDPKERLECGEKRDCRFDWWSAMTEIAGNYRESQKGRQPVDVTALIHELREERDAELVDRLGPSLKTSSMEKVGTMTRTISATEARVHLGELLRGVSEERATYYVERSGTPIAVVVPVEEYEALIDQQRGEYKRPEWLENALRIGQEVAKERAGKPPIDWDQMIEEGREERSEELLEGLL